MSQRNQHLTHAMLRKPATTTIPKCLGKSFCASFCWALAPFAVCFAVKDRALERDRPYQKEKKTTTIPNNMVQHAGETRDLQSATVFPRILPFSCTWKSIAFVKACVRHFLQKGHCSNLIFGAEHIGFLDSKKWSSPVQVDVCAILPAFRGFIVSGELLKQLGCVPSVQQRKQRN